MDMLVGLIDSLQLDPSLFLQFVIFFITYLVLYYVLFKPYNNAAQVRYERTEGSVKSADKYDEEIELLKREYGQKVKETNEKIKSIHGEMEEQSKKEVGQILAQATEQAVVEKQAEEAKLQKLYDAELAKVPSLSNDIKESLKKVLLDA